MISGGPFLSRPLCFTADSWYPPHRDRQKYVNSQDDKSAAVRVRFRVRFENGNASIFNRFFLWAPWRKKGNMPLSEYRSSTVSFFPSTVWAGREHGLDWFRVRFRYPLRWERVREPHAKQYSDSALIRGESVKVGGSLRKSASWARTVRFGSPQAPLFLRNTPSTAGNSMTGSGRPSPEPLLKKEAPPAVLGGGDNSGNALEASNALNYRVWGIPAVLSTGIPGNALRAFPGSFRSLSGISSGKHQPYWGYGPFSTRAGPPQPIWKEKSSVTSYSGTLGPCPQAKNLYETGGTVFREYCSNFGRESEKN